MSKITAWMQKREHYINVKQQRRNEMLKLHEVQYRLAQAGMTNRFWGMPEIRELPHILADDEQIICAVNGRYETGFAMLLVTDRRLLLVDKKILFLSMEDVRFDMITEVDYSAQLVGASLAILTLNKTLHFNTWRRHRLRQLTTYVQKRVMELRQMPESVQPGQSDLVPAYAASNHVLAPIYKLAASSAVGQTPALARPFPATPLMMRRRVSRFPTGVASLASRAQNLNHNNNAHPSTLTR